MKTIIACPQTEELRQLIDGSISAERQQDCTDHIESCAGCQARLESLATEGTNLSRVVEKLSVAEPVADSAYWPAINSLNRSLQPTLVPTPAPVATRGKNTSLSFLQPASDPAYIGRIAQFDVMRMLGRGGMGVVLEAFDSRLQRHVAIKFLDPQLAGDEISRQRFCREARTAASITHENVVAVYQVEKSPEEGLPYLVMQLIAGESLEQRLAREKTLPLREIVRIGMQASHGLAAAHAQGLIHRDIKPGNILLETANDRVKLTDFGLARATEDVKLTSTGFVSGTPLYMAPEQALGEQADPRSDLFSLGAVLYEMCSGKPPFAGNSALAIFKQITDGKQKPLREVNPALPEWLTHTVDRLLEKKPDDRIQTAVHLAELFEFEWALLKTTSEEVPTVCKIAERKRRIRNRWIAAGVGATFLAIGLFAGKFIPHHHDDANAPAAAGAAEPVSDAEPLSVINSNGAIWSVAFDPSGDTIAIAIDDGEVRLWDLSTGSAKATLNAHRGYAWDAQFSQNDEFLATAGADRLIKLWKPLESEPFEVFENSDAVRAGVAISHDGQTLFSAAGDGSLRVWSLNNGKAPLVETQQPGTVNAIALSPDDSTLATAGSDKIVRLWNARTLTQKLPLEGHTAQIYGLAFNHDGKRLASTGWDQTIRIWDAASGALIKSWKGHKAEIWTIAFSPDSARLATGSSDGAVKLWNAETGELLATYLGHKTGIHTVAFSRDGTRLASGGRDGAVRIWKME